MTFRRTLEQIVFAPRGLDALGSCSSSDRIACVFLVCRMLHTKSSLLLRRSPNSLESLELCRTAARYTRGMTRTAVVTGANRGLGLEVVKQLAAPAFS
ncbi:MAG: hypothetical protein HC933_11285 [Pleurocapsa sp. SU_196_0]|nr:hypothetical protein [Pleurocapsa sp. SU_196_0]